MIKSLLYRAKIKVRFIHDLRELFDDLPKEDKDGITAFYADHPGHLIDEDIDKIKWYFDHALRYFFQYEHDPYDHEAAARFADCVYRHAGKVFEKTTHLKPFRSSTRPLR